MTEGSNGTIERAEDNAERTVSYLYDPNGRLSGVYDATEERPPTSTILPAGC